MPKTDSIPACHQHRPDSRWRSCDACARLRQARIADHAEALLNKWPSLAWLTITPDDAGRRTIDVLRTAYLRHADTDAGIWTIERGAIAGRLHANILTHDHKIPRIPGAVIHVAPVLGSPRNVAAYMSKREQIPDLAHYAGRVYGRWGTVSDFLLAPDTPAAPRALAVETRLLKNWGPMGLADPRWQNNVPDQWQADENRAAAARHLPKLMALYGRAASKINQG